VNLYGEVVVFVVHNVWYCYLQDILRKNDDGLWLLPFFLISTYIMCIANVLTERRSLEKKIPALILPDYGFDFAETFTPFLVKYGAAPDIGQYVVAGLSVLWLIFGCQQPFIVFRRFLMIHSFLFLCRACCLLGTQLPNPYQGYPNQEWGTNLFYEALLVNLRYKVTRTDVFYSGHTVSMTCFALMIEYYHSNTLIQRCLSTLVWIITLATLYMIIAVKFHYTIDVIIAFQLTIFTWKLYHMATESHLVRQSLPVIDFLEGDVVVEDTYCEVFPGKFAKIYTTDKDKKRKRKNQTTLNLTNNNNNNNKEKHYIYLFYNLFLFAILFFLFFSFIFI